MALWTGKQVFSLAFSRYICAYAAHALSVVRTDIRIFIVVVVLGFVDRVDLPTGGRQLTQTAVIRAHTPSRPRVCLFGRGALLFLARGKRKKKTTHKQFTADTFCVVSYPRTPLFFGGSALVSLARQSFVCLARSIHT